MNYYPCNSGQPSAGGSNQFTGTLEQWNALTEQEKAMYDGGDWTNDYNGSPVDSAMSTTSERPLQNKVITQQLNTTYKSTDTIENTIDSADYIPFYDVSSGSTKRIAVSDADFGGGSGGHVIEDASGTTFTQRSVLKVENAYVEDDAVNDATILRSTNFVGTRAQWNALSAAEQAKYTSQDITDEYGEYPIDSAPTQGSTNPVSSGGVYDALQNLPSGGGALYFTSVACAATTGDFATVSNANITANHVVVSVEYANPSSITSDVTWTTASGSVTLNGTCASATTCSIVLVEKDN